MNTVASGSRNVARFIRHLRDQGFMVGVQETVAGLEAMQLAARTDSHWFYHSLHSLRSLSCKSGEDWQRFEQVYLRYWFPQLADPQAMTGIDPLRLFMTFVEYGIQLVAEFG